MTEPMMGAAAVLRHKLGELARSLASLKEVHDQASRWAEECATMCRDLAEDDTLGIQEVVSVSADHMPKQDTADLSSAVSKAALIGDIMSALGKIQAGDQGERRRKIGALLKEVTGGRPPEITGKSVPKYLEGLDMVTTRLLHAHLGESK